MDGWVEKVRASLAAAAQAVKRWSVAVWQWAARKPSQAGRFIYKHAIGVFLIAWGLASAGAVAGIMYLADPCRGTNLVCPDVQWIRPGYLAEDFRNLLWAASLVFGGAGAGAALINALRRTRLMHAEHELKRKGQDAETFSRAVDQLGSDQTAIRLGAIYALEGLMRSAFAEGGDKAFGRQIGETLAAFVREQSAHEMRDEAKLLEIGKNIDQTLALKDTSTTVKAAAKGISSDRNESNIHGHSQRLAVDREAAVIVVARSWPGKYRPRLHADRGVDFSNSQLGGLRLPHGADLQNFDFTGSDLRKSVLERVNLENAWLDEVDLKGARLNWSSLSGAAIIGADWVDVSIFGADISAAAIGFDSSMAPNSSQLAVARWWADRPPVLPFTVELPHRGDGKPEGDASPYDPSWSERIGLTV